MEWVLVFNALIPVLVVVVDYINGYAISCLAPYLNSLCGYSSMVTALILNLIGGTPVVKLSRIVGRDHADVYVKLEFLNPTGSHKDRIAYYMIKDALDRGLVKESGCVVEASSGNTAMAVAWVSLLLGLRAVLVVNEDASPVKVAAMEALGAKVILSRPEEKRDIAERIAREEGCVFLNQSGNEANVRAHYETTGPEILKALGDVDAFVMGIGTGGTVCGVGRYLKERLGSKVLIVGVVPKGSVITSPEASSRDVIEGLSTYSVPDIVKRYRDVIDRIIEVSYDEALKTLAKVVRYEGILGGPSTGANIYVALRVAKELGRGKKVVTIAPDTILKYPELLKEIKYLTQ